MNIVTPLERIKSSRWIKKQLALIDKLHEEVRRLKALARYGNSELRRVNVRSCTVRRHTRKAFSYERWLPVK